MGNVVGNILNGIEIIVFPGLLVLVIIILYRTQKLLKIQEDYQRNLNNQLCDLIKLQTELASIALDMFGKSKKN